MQERLQHFVNPAPSTPTPPIPQLEDIPNSPSSPSFMTAPSSPVETQSNQKDSLPLPNEPVTLPSNEPPVRRSGRIRKPPVRYNPAEYDLT